MKIIKQEYFIFSPYVIVYNKIILFSTNYGKIMNLSSRAANLLVKIKQLEENRKRGYN